MSIQTIRAAMRGLARLHRSLRIAGAGTSPFAIPALLLTFPVFKAHCTLFAIAYELQDRTLRLQREQIERAI